MLKATIAIDRGVEIFSVSTYKKAASICRPEGGLKRDVVIQSSQWEQLVI
jgi:hypothetical protein